MEDGSVSRRNKYRQCEARAAGMKSDFCLLSYDPEVWYPSILNLSLEKQILASRFTGDASEARKYNHAALIYETEPLNKVESLETGLWPCASGNISYPSIDQIMNLECDITQCLRADIGSCTN